MGKGELPGTLLWLPLLAANTWFQAAAPIWNVWSPWEASEYCVRAVREGWPIPYTLNKWEILQFNNLASLLSTHQKRKLCKEKIAWCGQSHWPSTFCPQHGPLCDLGFSQTLIFKMQLSNAMFQAWTQSEIKCVWKVLVILLSLKTSLGKNSELGVGSYGWTNKIL